MIECPEFDDKRVVDTLVDSSDNVTCKYDDGSIYKGLITGTEEAPQAGMVTYLHEEYNLGIGVRGGLPLELAEIAGSVKVIN